MRPTAASRARAAENIALRTEVSVVVMNTHHSGLGVARNLGSLGVRVIGLSSTNASPGNHSKHLRYRLAPDSLTQPSELRFFMHGLAAEIGSRAILVPTRDHDINFINAHRQELQHDFIIPFAAPDIIDRIMNKDRLFEVARSVGVRVPRGVTLRSDGDLLSARDLQFPCICKPLYASQWRRPGIWEAVGRQKAVKVDTFDELIEAMG